MPLRTALHSPCHRKAALPLLVTASEQRERGGLIAG